MYTKIIIGEFSQKNKQENGPLAEQGQQGYV